MLSLRQGCVFASKQSGDLGSQSPASEQGHLASGFAFDLPRTYMLRRSRLQCRLFHSQSRNLRASSYLSFYYIIPHSTSNMPSADLPLSSAGGNFDRLVDDLRVTLGSSGLTSEDVDLENLLSLMREYVSHEKEWARYAHADLTQGYTRNLVDEGNGKCNLVIITPIAHWIPCWQVSSFSSGRQGKEVRSTTTAKPIVSTQDTSIAPIHPFSFPNFMIICKTPWLL